MKKRSLVAALAMLVVSAIVLTSSTYAWFATSQTAAVEKVSSDIGTTSGSIYVSATGAAGSWVSNLTAQMLTDAGNQLPTQLTACSYDKEGDQWFTGGITPVGTERQFSATASTTVPAGTISYTFYVYSDTAAKVSLTPNFTRRADFVYALIKVDGATYLYGGSAAADSYKPIVAAGTAVDSKADGIIEDAEIPSDSTLEVADVAVSSTTPGVIELDFTSLYGEGNKKAVEVVVWAEGQDPNCHGSITTALSNDMSFDLAVA